MKDSIDLIISVIIWLLLALAFLIISSFISVLIDPRIRF